MSDQDAPKANGDHLALLGRLAAGLAHEIRNPLNGAQLHLAYLQRVHPAVDADAREALAVVNGELQRIARLVTDFLDFAQARPVRATSTSARSLLDRILPAAEAAARDAAVAIHVELPEDGAPFAGDAARLAVALENLVQNAIEASPDGGTVVVRAEREERLVRLEIRDRGVGFAPEAPLFAPFHSTKPTGTGLGLAVAQRIVADHGGAIRAERRGDETIFTIELPVADARPPQR